VNDKQIVKTNCNVKIFQCGWLSKVMWQYYIARGQICWDKGMFLICDGGYLRWPQSICPYSSAMAASAEGYFSSNLESIRKDVECTFGIMKKRWKILNNGLMYRDIKVCEKISVACSCLHNILVDIMDIKHSDTRVGRGAPLGKDGFYLDGYTHPPNVD
jgi:hypothetical protein